VTIKNQKRRQLIKFTRDVQLQREVEGEVPLGLV